jgi:hypothetical protein
MFREQQEGSRMQLALGLVYNKMILVARQEVNDMDERQMPT